MVVIVMNRLIYAEMPIIIIKQKIMQSLRILFFKGLLLSVDFCQEHNIDTFINVFIFRYL